MSISPNSSSNTTSNANSYFAFNQMIEFYQHYLLKYKHLGILLLNSSFSISIYYVLSEQGFFSNKVESRLEKKVELLKQLTAIYYRDISVKNFFNNGFIPHLSFLLEKKIQRKVKIKEPDTSVNLLLYFYSFLLKNPYDMCVFLGITRKENTPDAYSLSVVSYHSSRTDEKDFYKKLDYKKGHCIFTKKSHVFLSLFSIYTQRNAMNLNLKALIKALRLPNKFGHSFIFNPNTNVVSKKQDSPQITIGYQMSSYNQNSKQLIKIDLNDILLNVEICGMIGRGKTQLVISILEQLLSFNIGTLVFDIKGEYAKVFVQNPNVEVYTIGPPNPLCLNIFETTDDADVRATLLIIDEMFMSSKLELSPSMKNLFEFALFKTHKSNERNVKTFVANLFAAAENLKRQHNTSYLQQTLDALLNRLNFIFNPLNFEVLGVSKTTLDLSALNKGKTIILDLSQLQRRAARPSDIFLICNMILKFLYRFALSQRNASKLKYVVIMEEAINIVPNFYHVESSASLITAENNFILGRSLGIGHITVTQMWRSISNIVHGNSATKIIFRTSENIEEVGQNLNLTEEEKEQLKTLPAQQCFIFFENTKKGILIQTIDQSIQPVSESKYLSILLRRYKNKFYPLLYKNFIEMRNSISNYYFSPPKISYAEDNSFIVQSNISQNMLLDHFSLSHSKESKIDTGSILTDIKAKHSINPNDMCLICPLSSNTSACTKYQLIACSVYSYLINLYSYEDLIQLIKVPKAFSNTIKKLIPNEQSNNMYLSIMTWCIIRHLITEKFFDSAYSSRKMTELIEMYHISNS